MKLLTRNVFGFTPIGALRSLIKDKKKLGAHSRIEWDLAFSKNWQYSALE